MNYHLTIHFESLAEMMRFASHLERLPPAPPNDPPPCSPRAREPGDDDEPAPPKAPAKSASSPATGPELLAWTKAASNPAGALKNVQTVGRKLGFGWRVSSWKPDQVAAVTHELATHHGRGHMGAKT